MPDRPFRRIIVVLAAILVAGCQADVLSTSPRTNPSSPPAQASSVNDLDPASPCVLDPDPANGGHPPPPDDVVAAKDPTDPTGVVAVRAVGLGDLVLPSSALLVTDFFGLSDFDIPNMPKVDLGGVVGHAPVCLHIARLEPVDERAAFVHVKLSDKPVVRWGAPVGFGVDGGTGGIGSTEAVRAATQAIVDGYLPALEAHDVNTWSWANITTDPSSRANVIGFSTGYGDGGYPAYAGFTKDGRVGSVVIDLGVVPWRWLSLIGPVGALPSSAGVQPFYALSPRSASQPS